ncbi:hypothetical protein [Streptomyces sp. CB01881]|uniref:MmyB family transcriptional regulator n=1 Tax=Streptomyces sp. CB01881 TaxID=2078691 RepID=UPI001F11F41E|nr:hypothetical protein [Streptomyces sp. CB01881]
MGGPGARGRRPAAGRRGPLPGRPGLAALITGLSDRGADFRRIWATGEIVMCAAGRKRLRHPVTGPLTLDFETLHVPAEPGETGLVVHVFRAGKGTPEAAALDPLAATIAPVPGAPAAPVPGAPAVPVPGAPAAPVPGVPAVPGVPSGRRD